MEAETKQLNGPQVLDMWIEFIVASRLPLKVSGFLPSAKTATFPKCQFDHNIGAARKTANGFLSEY